MATEWEESVLDPVEALIERWEARGESDAVATLLPAWRANAGLTDGWQDVLVAIRQVPQRVALPEGEVATLDRVAQRIETALRNR